MDSQLSHVIAIPCPLLEVISYCVQQWFSKLFHYIAVNSILKVSYDCGPTWTHKKHYLSDSIHAVKTNGGFIPWSRKGAALQILG